ncbi:MAG: YdbL family protein [Marinobacterium sp.]|nr:YdbL family protein [Marinobacterium sp.]
MKKILFTLLAGLVLSQSVWALSLNDAKARGLVGERSNGYLGIVVSQPDQAIRVLVEDINRKRRTAYQSKARKAGVDLKVIELRVGERLHQRALPGHYVQDGQGRWSRR